MSLSSLSGSRFSGWESSPQSLVSDARSVNTLRSMAAKDPQSAIQDTAKQFETLFMKEIIKSMRQASLATGFLENPGSQLGTEMLDGQYATLLSGMRGGLSEAITRQLEQQMGMNKAQPAQPILKPLEPFSAPPQVRTEGTESHQTRPADLSISLTKNQGDMPTLSSAQQKQTDFIKRHIQAAHAASAETGIPANFMVAQAAHESGWGRREIKMADGSPSFNVFGIKAGPGWRGKTAEVTTTEYLRGEARKVTAQFRAYDSYEAAFKDYASLIKNSPRYNHVVARASTAEGFAQGLQKAGYATDPAYADKLTRVIHTTLRLQRSVI